MTTTKPTAGATRSVEVQKQERTSSTPSTPSEIKSRIVKKKKKKAASTKYLWPLLHYAFDVLSMILSLIKWPLALFITILLGRALLYSSLTRISGLLSGHLRSSVCQIPYAPSLLNSVIPQFCNIAPVDFEPLIAIQKASTSSIPELTGSAPLRLKKAEMATNDLRIILATTELSCKDTLDDALSSFTAHSRDAGRWVQKTVVRVSGLLDSSIALNEWAISELSRPTGFWGSRKGTTRTYIKAMDALSQKLARIIETNTLAYEALDRLEEDLYGIHEIVSLEKRFQETEQSEVLSSLWSILGGNREAKASYKMNLSTLDDFERGRKQTKELVAQTTVAYSKMMMQIENLREEVARPGLGSEEIPVEIHVRTIQLGIESLKGTRDARQAQMEDDLRLL